MFVFYHRLTSTNTADVDEKVSWPSVHSPGTTEVRFRCQYREYDVTFLISRETRRFFTCAEYRISSKEFRITKGKGRV
jgi:hypothetical protein